LLHALQSDYYYYYCIVRLIRNEICYYNTVELDTTIILLLLLFRRRDDALASSAAGENSRTRHTRFSDGDSDGARKVRPHDTGDRGRFACGSVGGDGGGGGGDDDGWAGCRTTVQRRSAEVGAAQDEDGARCAVTARNGESGRSNRVTYI